MKAPYKVLYIEDDEIIAAVKMEKFQDDIIEHPSLKMSDVAFAGNLKDAENLLKNTVCPIVISDFRFSGRKPDSMGGIDVLRLVIEEHKETQFFFLTSYDAGAVTALVRAQGMVIDKDHIFDKSASLLQIIDYAHYFRSLDIRPNGGKAGRSPRAAEMKTLQ